MIGNRLSVAAGVALAAGMMAAFAPRAEAVTATATGGTTNEYKQDGKQWRAFVFTNLPVSEIPKMTANDAPSGVASASTDGWSLWPWYAMSQTGNRWSSSGGAPQWLQYQFASGKAINGYEFTGFVQSQTPSNFTLQASNDGSNWTTLDTQTGNSALTRYYVFINTVSYTYYRLNITAITGGGVVSLTSFILYSSIPSLDVSAGGDMEYLMVAAGGAGGSSYDTGGGGAGGMLTGSVTLAAGTYPVTIGWGGQERNGRDSTFSTLRAIGGGVGSLGSPGDGAAGGSGGGSVRESRVGGAGTDGPPKQGNKGGNGHSSNLTGGGGGGAGGPGVDANATDMISAGGPGLTNSMSGSPVVYAAGGKGYNRSGSDSDKSTSGAANTGNGGHGGSSSVAGGAGGSGIVIIRYALPPKGTVIMLR